MSWKVSKKRGLDLWCSIKVMLWFAMLLLQKLIGLAVQGSASRRGHFTLQPASSQSGHFDQTFLSTLTKIYRSTIHECVFICEHSKNLHARLISLRDLGIPGRHLSLGFSLASTGFFSDISIHLEQRMQADSAHFCLHLAELNLAKAS